MTRPSTAFVLSGGASLGAVHAGMLGALFERGITADLLVGTSAGAINAAFIASRPQSVDTASALRRVWCDLLRDDVFPVRCPNARRRPARQARPHRLRRALRALVARHLQFDDLSDARSPARRRL